MKEKVKKEDAITGGVIHGMRNNITVKVDLDINGFCEKMGFINVDEEDFKKVLDGAEQIYIGNGHATGEGKGGKAAYIAINNPLMAMPLGKAKNVLILTTCSLDIDLEDIEETVEMIAKTTHPEANTIIGAFFDEEMENGIRVDIIASH